MPQPENDVMTLTSEAMTLKTQSGRDLITGIRNNCTSLVKIPLVFQELSGSKDFIGCRRLTLTFDQ